MKVVRYGKGKEGGEEDAREGERKGERKMLRCCRSLNESERGMLAALEHCRNQTRKEEQSSWSR
jgi:hypothetical protein